MRTKTVHRKIRTPSPLRRGSLKTRTLKKEGKPKESKRIRKKKKKKTGDPDCFKGKKKSYVRKRHHGIGGERLRAGTFYGKKQKFPGTKKRTLEGAWRRATSPPCASQHVGGES